MTKRFVALSLLFTTLLFACANDDESETSPTTTVTVSGVANVNVPRGRSTTLTLAVSSAGIAQATSLSINGLPPGVTAILNPIGGTPPFNSTVTYTASGTATIGDAATAAITATTPDGKEKQYILTVKVSAPSDCAQDLAGAYTASDLCMPGGSRTYTATIAPDPSQPNKRIIISDFGSTNASVYADVDCGTSSISIPTQVIAGGFVVNGNGIFTPTSLSYEYEIHGGGTTTCTTNMSR